MKPAGSLNDPQPHSDAPPKINTNRRRVVVLAIAGAIVAIILIAVLFNIDRGASTQPRQTNPNVVELIPPDTLDSNAAGGDFNRIATNLSELGAENTWIQTTRDGKLAQQYRFASHDPNPEGLPPGWSKMIQPEIQIYMSDDRVLTLKSQTAMLRATSRNLESGKMTGDVVIRLYEIDAGQSIGANTIPSMEARTNEASFDNILGEIRADGAIDIQTPTAHLPGSGLRVQINEVANRIAWLQLEKVQTIRLAAIEEESGESTPAGEPANAKPRASNRERRAQSRDPAASKAQSSQGTFYRLTLQDKVHIQQRGERMEWTADGDKLHIVFSMKGSVLDQAASRSSTPIHGGPSLSAAILSFAIATTAQDSTSGLFTPTDDDIFITCAKGVTMAPLGDADIKPKSADEAHMELVGAPAHLRSVSESIDIHCQSLGYLTKQQRILVKGTTATPARINGPEAEGEFTEFWLNRLKNVGGFVGAGWMILRERSDPAPEQAHEKDLRIEWLERVDLTFAKPAPQGDSRESFGQLQKAAFAGKVNVVSDELLMNADAMTVTLPSREEGVPKQRSLESIVANGQVHAVSLADEGSLSCEHLDVRFERGAAGQTIPSHLAASGDVMAKDRDDQIVWCDQMDVDFEPLKDNNPASPSSASTRTRAQMKQMIAAGNVQARVQDGVRAFGDRLEAKGEQSIVLLGNDVMVLRDRGAIHGGTRLEMNQIGMSATWPGPGQFLSFASALVPDEPVRMARPILDAIDPAVNPVQTRASWTDSMNYDGQFNDGAGALKLTGNVQGDSRPSALEHNTIKSQSLTLQFAHAANEGGTPQPAPENGAVQDLAQGKRDLKLFIAEGNAEIESHTWLLADHSDVTRVLFISGPYIEYDDQTFEAKVNGDGALLVRDERPEPQEQQPAASRPFDVKGTTRFRWSNYLHMTRIEGALYQIQMTGDVSAIHEALDKSRSWMRGEQLVAIVERTATATPAAPQQRDGVLDLGGTMELRKLTGAGGIVINTPTREITTDAVEYDYATGIASLIAQQGNTVYVKTTGNPNPIRAQSMSWNLIEDKITVTNLRGTAPR